MVLEAQQKEVVYIVGNLTLVIKKNAVIVGLLILKNKKSFLFFISNISICSRLEREKEKR